MSEKAGMFLANPCNATVTLIVNDCRNDGTIRQTITDDYEDYYFALNGNCGASSTIAVNEKTISAADRKNLEGVGLNAYGPADTMRITINDDETIKFTKSENANVAYYEVSVMTYLTHTPDNPGGGSGRYYVIEKIQATGSEEYTSMIKALPFTCNLHSQYSEDGNLAGNPIVKDGSGNNYYLCDGEDGYYCGEGDLFTYEYIGVSAYDSNGNLISTVVY